jgi:hypothetical protein
MASNYPTSLDTFSNPSGTDSLNSPSHSLQHADINDAVEALETKIGIGDSPAGSATAGQVLTAQGGGTAIWETPEAGGLILVNTTSFSAVASQSLNDVFSADYNNYRVLINITAVSADDNDIGLKLRASGSDTSANYKSQRLFATGATVGAGANPRGTDEFSIATTDKDFNDDSYTILDFFAPYQAQKTKINVNQSGNFNTAFYFQSGGGVQTDNTQFDGFTLIPNSGTITGVISVYGYKD